MTSNRAWLKNVIHNATSHMTQSNQQHDLLMAINVLDEVASALRQRIADKHMCNAIQGLTYEEWRTRGYTVVRGQRHTGRREDGICTFGPNQVVPLHGYTGNARKYPTATHYDDFFDFADDDIPF